MIRATQSGDGWNVRYLFADERSSEALGTLAVQDGEACVIPVSSQKGFKGQLRLAVHRMGGGVPSQPASPQFDRGFRGQWDLEPA